MFRDTYITSESVSRGHPDKICDQISDAILDEFLKQDKESKVAVECFITNNLLVVGGEAHSKATVDIIGTAKRVIEGIGYDGTNGFNPESAIFLNTLHEQSPDIRMGIDKYAAENQGAGDQGIMFGYACNDVPDIYMPLPIFLANLTMLCYDNLMAWGFLPGMRPDAKCQYTVKYDKDGKPSHIDTLLISMQHDENVDLNKLRGYVTDVILPKMFDLNPSLTKFFDRPYSLIVNPTGKFVIGGPEGDTGLTGRKIIADTYGGACPHGGGAFSGKDASKVDRSAAYAARYIAKNLVAAGVADEITVQLAYAIGIAEPLSVHVDATNPKMKESKIEALIKEIFPLTPYQIINKFGLKSPIYFLTSHHGHFGRTSFPWETIDKVDEIKKILEI